MEHTLKAHVSWRLKLKRVKLLSSFAYNLNLRRYTKSHYTFNLRDLSKVLQGILLITPQNCPTKDVMTRLWAGAYTRSPFSSTSALSGDRGCLGGG